MSTTSLIVTGLSFYPPISNFFFFEPGKLIQLDYTIKNTGNSLQKVKMHMETDDELKYSVSLSKNQTRLPPNSEDVFTVLIDVPVSLSPGSHDVKVVVSEDKKTEGMAGVIGFAHNVRVINPYETGHPEAELSIRQLEDKIKLQLAVFNAGRTDIIGLIGKIDLMRRNREVENFFTDSIENLKPFKYGTLNTNIPVNSLAPGVYFLNIIFKGESLKQDHGKEEIVIGAPKIEASSLNSLDAGKENRLSVSVLCDWPDPIEDVRANIFVLSPSSELIFQDEEKITLKPENNLLNFNGNLSENVTGGIYKAKLTLSSFPVFKDASVTNLSVVIHSDYIEEINEEKETEQGLYQDISEAVSSENAMVLAPVYVYKNVNYKAFFLLIITTAVFAFSLGQYLARS